MKHVTVLYNVCRKITTDVVTISAKMKAYINNNLHRKPLDLHENADIKLERNDICHLLATKVCAELREFEKGRTIRFMMDLDSHGTDIVVKNAWIDFYGACGDS